MSKREFKVGDEVLVRGKIASVELETVVIDVGISWLVGMHKNEVTHAPVKDDTVYEYKYLLYIKNTDYWQETVGYFTSKKEAMREHIRSKPYADVIISSGQRLTHTKRIRK